MFSRFRRESSTTSSSLADTSDFSFPSLPGDIICVITSHLRDDYKSRFCGLGRTSKKIRELVLRAPLPNFLSLKKYQKRLTIGTLIEREYYKLLTSLIDKKLGPKESAQFIHEAIRCYITSHPLISKCNFSAVTKVELGECSLALLDSLLLLFPSVERLKFWYLRDGTQVLRTYIVTTGHRLAFDSTDYAKALTKLPKLRSLKISLDIDYFDLGTNLEEIALGSYSRDWGKVDPTKIDAKLSSLPNLRSLTSRNYLPNPRVLSDPQFFQSLKKLDVRLSGTARVVEFEALGCERVTHLVLRLFSTQFPNLRGFPNVERLELRGRRPSLIPRDKVRFLVNLVELIMEDRRFGALSELEGCFPCLTAFEEEAWDGDEEDQSEESFDDAEPFNNSLSIEDYKTILSWPNLTRLSLRKLICSELGPLLGKTPGLRSLSLWTYMFMGSREETVPFFAAFHSLTDLTALKLKGVDLRHEAIVALSSLRTLEKLTLAIPNHNLISDDWLNPISKLSNLRILSLSHDTYPLQGVPIFSKEKKKPSNNGPESEANLLTLRGLALALAPLKKLEQLEILECTYQVKPEDLGKLLSPNLQSLSISSPTEDRERILGSRKLFRAFQVVCALFVLSLCAFIFWLVQKLPKPEKRS